MFGECQDGHVRASRAAGVQLEDCATSHDTQEPRVGGFVEGFNEQLSELWAVVSESDYASIRNLMIAPQCRRR